MFPSEVPDHSYLAQSQNKTVIHLPDRPCCSRSKVKGHLQIYHAYIRDPNAPDDDDDDEESETNENENANNSSEANGRVQLKNDQFMIFAQTIVG